MTAVPAPLAPAGADVRAPAPITSAGVATHAAGLRPQRLSANSLRPYIGILGVLIGALLSTIGSRITTFGLADLRGGLHFGFDEGAWMTTSFGVGQMLVGVACPYLGAIFSVRRVLLHGMALLFVASLLGPLSPNLTAFLTAQFLAGVGAGTFIPLTIGFIVRNLPQRLVVYGLAVYAMNSELSQNVSASLEGWYSDNVSWRWIEWQYCAALPLMFACIWYGVPREKINTACFTTSTGPGSSIPASASRFFTLALTRATGSTGTTTASSMAFCFPAACSRSPLLCASFTSRSRSSIFGCSPEKGLCRSCSW